MLCCGIVTVHFLHDTDLVALEGSFTLQVCFLMGYIAVCTWIYFLLGAKTNSVVSEHCESYPIPQSECGNSGWITVLQTFNLHRERYCYTIGPPRYEIVEKGASWIHDLMGFSCLWFLTAIAVFLWITPADVAPENSRIGLATFYCWWLVLISVCSILGDYVCAKLASEPEPPGTVVTWWQKALVGKTIDEFTATLACGLTTDLLVIQMNYSGHLWFYAPLIFVGILGLTCMYAGRSWKLKYAETKSADAIWNAYFLHTMWHFCGSVMVSLQMYGLITHGFETPGWLSWF